jgi:hypothetical protein
VGVEHGGHLVVPEPWRHGTDVSAAWEQVGSEGMASGVGADGLRQTGAVDRDRDGDERWPLMTT